MKYGRLIGAIVGLGVVLGLTQPASAESWSAIMYVGPGSPTVVATRPTQAACQAYIDGVIQAANEKFNQAYKASDFVGMSDAQNALKLLAYRTSCARTR